MRVDDPILGPILRDIERDDELSRALGVDLTPPGPLPEHAPPAYLPLDEWLRRSEEVHRFLETERLNRR